MHGLHQITHIMRISAGPRSKGLIAGVGPCIAHVPSPPIFNVPLFAVRFRCPTNVQMQSIPEKASRLWDCGTERGVGLAIKRTGPLGCCSCRICTLQIPHSTCKSQQFLLGSQCCLAGAAGRKQTRHGCDGCCCWACLRQEIILPSRQPPRMQSNLQ